MSVVRPSFVHLCHVRVWFVIVVVSISFEYNIGDHDVG